VSVGTSGPEAQIRRLLAAYPRRMRAEQGDEIVATALDTLPPGVSHLPLRMAVDLVRGGLRTRHQRRPPFLTRLAFEFGLTIHPRWIWWIYDRLEDPRYRRNAVLRRIATGFLPYLPVLALSRRLDHALLWMTVSMAMSFVGWRLWGEWERNRLRARHGLVAGGSNPHMVWVRIPTTAVPNTPIARLAAALGLPLSLGLLTYLWAVRHQRFWPVSDFSSEPAPADVVALARPYGVAGAVVGLLLAAAGVRALRRSRSIPPRPVVGERGTTLAALGAGTAVAVGAALLSLTTYWQWVEWEYSQLVAVLGPTGVGLLALAVRLGLAGRRRGWPVGLWEVAPRLGPRITTRLATRWAVDRMPDADVWTPEAEAGGSAVRRAGRAGT